MTHHAPEPPAAALTLRSVGAVLPAFNEVAVIADVVERTWRALGANGIAEREVVVVDDGSRDGTGDAARAVAARLPGVRVVSHPVNRGYGAALRTGFESVHSDHTWLLDSDAQFDPADLSILMRAWRPGVLVAGYRQPRSDPLMRRANHAAFFGLVRLALGPTVRDVNCAFKLFPRALGVGLHSDGAVVSTELVLRARRQGVCVVEVAVPHHQRRSGTPTGAHPRVIAKAFAELWKLRADVRRGRRPRGAVEVPGQDA